LEDFDRAVQAKGDLRRAYHYRGVAHRQLGNDEQALSDFSHSLELDPFQFDVLMSRGQTLFRMGDHEDALKDCDAALSIEPDSTEAQRFHKVITQRLGM
jgi:tetratricopeptide (TPR) repeat protein